MTAKKLNFSIDGIEVTGFEHPRAIPPESARQQHYCYCMDLDCRQDCDNSCVNDCPSACWNSCSEDPGLESSAYSSQESSIHNSTYSSDKSINYQLTWMD